MNKKPNRNEVYSEDKNQVIISGTIQRMPEGCRYIPRPLISFNLESYRKKRNENDEDEILVFDLNQIVLFDDENFHKQFKDGDRILVEGELQSRNFTKDIYEVDETITFAVQNYMEIYSKFPTNRDPKHRTREPIDWKKLLDMQLIPGVPDDSMIKEDGSKQRSDESPYIYRVDENGEVYKETQHVAYEVVALRIERLEEELDVTVGDVNLATIIGKITKSPYFDYIGQESKVPFCSFNVCSKSKIFHDRVFYNNVICWSHLAQKVFEKFQKDEIVKVVGRLQSRTYTKEIIKRWKSPSGKRKKKVIVLNLTAREISASKVERCILPVKENKENNEIKENKED
jgi:single-stranded DNA-binding protein